MTWRVWFWLVSLSVLWGGSFFFAKVTLGSFGPLTVVFGRVALAALALNLVNPLCRDAPWPSFFAMGALNNALPFSRSSGARPTSPQGSPRSSTPRRRCSRSWSRTC